jgi:hypothetical protein
MVAIIYWKYCSEFACELSAAGGWECVLRKLGEVHGNDTGHILNF